MPRRGSAVSRRDCERSGGACRGRVRGRGRPAPHQGGTGAAHDRGQDHQDDASAPPSAHLPACALSWTPSFRHCWPRTGAAPEPPRGCSRADQRAEQAVDLLPVLAGMFPPQQPSHHPLRLLPALAGCPPRRRPRLGHERRFLASAGMFLPSGRRARGCTHPHPTWQAVCRCFLHPGGCSQTDQEVTGRLGLIPATTGTQLVLDANGLYVCSLHPRECSLQRPGRRVGGVPFPASAVVFPRT